MEFFFCKALGGLATFDLLRFGRHFARLHRVVHDWPVAGNEASYQTIERVCQAVNYALMWYPKRVHCLQRAAVTTCLLRSAGVPAKMVLGAQKVPFKAHAWVEVEDKAVNERMDVLGKYGVWERC